MRMVLYSVLATLPDEATASEYLLWLTEGQLRKSSATGHFRHGSPG